MKKLLLSSLIIVAVTTLAACNKPKTEPESTTATQANEDYIDKEHTAENSLDWNGIYEGTLPCADCPGIKTALTLNLDKTYTLEETYLERDVKPLVSKGTFNFDSKNTSIIVLDNAAEQRQYFIGEGFADARTMDGSEIDGPLKEHYKLKKVS